ncbi:MAG: DedA family protein [Methanococcaceae archaeon]
MIEHLINFIAELTPFWLYVLLFIFSYIENVFPPSPSDLVVVIGGSLIGKGVINFVPALIFSTIGSVIGFMTLFYLGYKFKSKLLVEGKMKFISREMMQKVDLWFAKYHYGIIIVNRFLPGTRSAISFFAGAARLGAWKTVFLATISALAWNTVILFLGKIFGENIKLIDKYINTYSDIVLILTVLAVTVWYFIHRAKKKKKQSSGKK